LKNGYEEVVTEEADLAPSLNGASEAAVNVKPPKSKPKKKRGR
jgi:hypothetical protein